MKIATAQIKPYCRRLIDPLRTAHGEIGDRRGFIIALGSDESHIGFGESPLPLFGTRPDMIGSMDTDHLLVSAADSLVGKTIPSSLDDVAVDLGHLLPVTDPGLYFGLEMALCDLAAKIVGQPLNQWLSAEARRSVPVNYLIMRPVEDWEKLVTAISTHGYRAVKVKVAVGSVDDDYAFVKRLRTVLGRVIAIRLDANRGWDFDTALSAMNRMARFGIEYVEEPLAGFNPENMQKLQSQTAIPIALDESISGIDNLDAVMSSKTADVLILKPSVIGGMSRTLDIIANAAQYDCRCVITSNLETEIGTAALLHLASAVSMELPPCGLDTLRLFENADTTLATVKDGAIKVPAEMGLGVEGELWGNL